MSMAEPEIRKIIHVDMDAFYASVEQRDDPELRGKPVAVGGRQRGVVMAASYEARKFGVRSAMPSATAKRLCAELVFVKPRFDVYKEVSRQIREIFAGLHAAGRAAVARRGLSRRHDQPQEHAAASATSPGRSAPASSRSTGLTASAGISYNKFLAKLASDHRKPNGQSVIPPEKGAAFVEVLPVAKFHGVGPVTAEKMNRLGIHTGADLKAQSLEFLRAVFRQVRHLVLSPSRAARTIGRWCPTGRASRSARRPPSWRISAGRPRSRTVSRPMARRRLDLLRERTGVLGRTVTVKVKYADFQIVTRSRTLNEPVTSREMLERTSVELVRSIFPLEKRVRLLGVSLSNMGTARRRAGAGAAIDTRSMSASPRGAVEACART